jgi:uncharacterized protein with PIN domain
MTDNDATDSDEHRTDTDDPERAAAVEATAPEATHTPDETAVVVDAMLGKLATYLRMCGYDATYTGERGLDSESETLAVAATEDRLVLTRDRALAARAERSVLLTEREVEAQLAELRKVGFALELADEPARCSACNGPLERVDRTEPTPDYAPETHERPVWRCRQCGQHFWKGSHWTDVAETLDEL